MKSLVLAALVALAVGFGPGVADAQNKSKVIYTNKSWQVKLVSLNGALNCQARVASGSSSFSIWAAPGRPLKLHFYSKSWAFGKRHNGNLRVKIDRYPTWKLTNARLMSHSVFFDLPNSSAGAKFLREVRSGSSLRLYNSKGSYVRGFTLSGSSGSISALARCVSALKKGSSGGGSNPFD